MQEDVDKVETLDKWLDLYGEPLRSFVEIAVKDFQLRECEKNVRKLNFARNVKLCIVRVILTGR